MSYEKVIAKLGEDAELVAFIKGVKSNEDSLVLRATALETENQKIKEKATDIQKSRDDLKRIVKETTNLDVLNEDSLKTWISELKGSKGDDLSATQIKDLQARLQAEVESKSNLEKQFKAKYDNMELESYVLSKVSGLGITTENGAKIINNLVRDGLVKEDGKFIYKENGITKFDGNNQVMTLESNLDALKLQPEFAGFFGPTVKAGGGTQSNNNGGQTSFKDMTETQRVELFRKDPVQFNQLKAQG